MLEITQINYKTKCDFAGCKNMADCVLSDKNDSKRRISFCKDCLQLIYESYAKAIVPKGIESPFKRQKKLR